MPHSNLLLLSDGSPIFPILSRVLTAAGHQVTTTCQTEEALQLLGSGRFPLVITCLSNAWTDTRPFLRAVRELNPDAAVIILRLGPEVRSPVGAFLVKDAGYDFKPFGWLGLRRLVNNCLSN
jgi:DNA-binding NtrC family response regulator